MSYPVCSTGKRVRAIEPFSGGHMMTRAKMRIIGERQVAQLLARIKKAHGDTRADLIDQLAAALLAQADQRPASRSEPG
ncbi:MAG TPA: hypothetical protein VMZ22_05600 [Acidimicrobiales bacterium]|nr:hypothetical protein [Acidimicrobiales bacterium]